MSTWLLVSCNTEKNRVNSNRNYGITNTTPHVSTPIFVPTPNSQAHIGEYYSRLVTTSVKHHHILWHGTIQIQIGGRGIPNSATSYPLHFPTPRFSDKHRFLARHWWHVTLHQCGVKWAKILLFTTRPLYHVKYARVSPKSCVTSLEHVKWAEIL